jgi:hypothetical protein
MAVERHGGLYVAAREGDDYQEWQALMSPARPFFHPTKKYLTRTVPPPSSSPGTGPDPQHYYRASPITTLRIHINRDGWAQWGEYDLALALDPSMGDAFVSGTDMLVAADARRARIALGLPPAPYPELSWGQPIAMLFLDLTRLTLQLETFAWRVAELDRIVECAKARTFPIERTKALTFPIGGDGNGDGDGDGEGDEISGCWRGMARWRHIHGGRSVCPALIRHGPGGTNRGGSRCI